jgi:methyl-accepting chemotaxis protein
MAGRNRFSVARALVLLPALAVAGIAGLALLLLHSISGVYDAASYATVNTVPSLHVLGEAETHLATARVNFWRHLAESDSAALANYESKIAASRQSIAKALKDYEPLISDDTDKGMLQADRDDIAAYDQLIDEALAASRAGNKNQAVTLVNSHQAVVDKVVADLTAHRVYNEKLGAEGAETGARIKVRSEFTGVGLAALAALLVASVGYWVFRRITRDLGGEPTEVAAVAARVARGDFSSQIMLRPGDTQSLFATVARMQTDLRERMVLERSAAAENQRIRVALDRVAVGAMLADTDGKIVYANDFARGIFRNRATDIRTQLPQFDPDAIVGHSFDLFHRNAAHQRNMLANLSGNHTTEIKLGGATLRFSANPVMDADGRRLGTVVQWADRTHEVQAELEIHETVEKAIAGDLTSRIPEDGKEGFFKALSVGMNRLTANMADVVRQMSLAAAEVRTGADEISRGNLNLSQRTEQQASSLEETASSMEEMTSTVKQNADNAAQANQLAAAARDQAERGGKVVSSAVAAMSEINAASKKIADIIGVIDEIAFQTNLLALNAAVEAARAGEQGRGFAVVASEVRNLASRSAAAAKEIKGLIQDSVGKVNDGTKLVDESGAVLAEIVTGVKKVTDVVAEIAASSREQAAGIEQVNSAVTSMDAATQQNAALVEEASAAAQALTDQARNLMDLIEGYTVGDGAGPARAAPRMASATSAKAGERRAASRPWAGTKNGPAKPAAEPAPAPARKAAVNDDSEWKDF